MIKLSLSADQTLMFHFYLFKSLLRDLPPKLDPDRFLLYTRATPMGSSGPNDSG